MSGALSAIDHELAGLRAKLRWDHIAEHTRQVIRERIDELEAKRRAILESP